MQNCYYTLSHTNAKAKKTVKHAPKKARAIVNKKKRNAAINVARAYNKRKKDIMRIHIAKVGRRKKNEMHYNSRGEINSKREY